MRLAFLSKDPLPDPLLMRLAGLADVGGHDVEVFVPAGEPDLVGSVVAYAPAALLFAPHGGFEAWSVALAQTLRSALPGVPVLFAGPEVADHPDLDGVDVAMTGQPEATFAEVLRRLAAGTGLSGTPGCVVGEVRGADPDPVPVDHRPEQLEAAWRRYPCVQNLGALRFALGEGVVENNHADARIGPAELGRRFQPSARYSVAEAVRRLRLQASGRTRVAFLDDSLLSGDAGWLEGFLPRYKREVGLPFSCAARPDQLVHAAERIAAAGCDLVRLGIESGDEGLRGGIVGEHLNDEVVLEVAARLTRSGIRIHTVLFLGVPGETEETALRALSLNRKIRPAHAFAIPYVGDDGASFEGLDRLRSLLPLMVDVPLLSRLASAAMSAPLDDRYGAVFQIHHDLTTLLSGDLGRREVLRIARAMRGGRGG